MAAPKKQNRGSTLPVEIVVEARTAAAVANLEKLAAQTKKTEAEARKLAAETAKLDAKTASLGSTASTIAAPAMTKVATASKAAAVATDNTAKIAMKGSSILGKLANAAKSSGVGFNLLTTGVQGTLMAFGPWGMAASVVTGLLTNLVSGQLEAAAAAKKHTAEVKAQNRELERLRANEALARLRADDHTAARDEIRRLSGGAEIDEERTAIENALAEHGAGKSTSGLQSRLTELRVKELEIQKQQLAVGHDLFDAEARRNRKIEERRIDEEIAATKREDELRLLKERGDQEGKQHKAKKERSSEEIAWLNEMVRLRNAGGMSREGSDSRAFAEELKNVKDPRFERPGLKLIDPFSTEEEMQRIDDESKARIKALEDAKDEAAERSKKRHEEEVARQEELIERQEKAGQVAGDTVAGLASAWLQAGDLSAKGFKKALAAWGQAESIKLAGIAISEGVQALVSLAMYNFPGAAMHGAAAAAAAAGAAAIAGLTAAVGGFGNFTKHASGKNPGGKGFGNGDSFGGGSGGPAANSGPSSSNSQKDQLPTAGDNVQHAQMGAGGGSSSGKTFVFQKDSITVLGAIDEKSALKIKQGIQKAEKSAGKIAV